MAAFALVLLHFNTLIFDANFTKKIDQFIMLASLLLDLVLIRQFDFFILPHHINVSNSYLIEQSIDR